MAKVYALMKFTAPDGNEYDEGASLDLPRETDKQKADFDEFIARGIVSQNEPATQKGSSQRTSRRNQD